LKQESGDRTANDAALAASLAQVCV